MSSSFSARYETLAKLGAGGMATVYAGRPRDGLGATPIVAIKRAHEQVRGDPALVRALTREARLVARIRHPNVVGVLDVEEDDGDVVLVLDYVEGPTLRELSRKLGERAAPREAVRILLDAAAGLDAAHRTTDEHGRALAVVHRDVSPSNVLVGRDGIAKITDFGIAKSLEGATQVTAHGVLKGKLSYMAPEYVTSNLSDARSDLFSLGVVAWETLARRRLYKAATDVETLMRITRSDAPRLTSVAPELGALDAIVARALARDPKERPASVGAFAAELQSSAAAAGLLASHAEVAALVESLFGDELSRRRLQFRATMETVVGHLELPEAWLPPASAPPLAPASVPAPPPAPVAAPAVMQGGLGRHAVAVALGLVVAAVGAGALLAGASCSREEPAAEPPPPEPPSPASS